MVQEEEIPKSPSSAEELLATPMPVDDQSLNSVVNVLVPPVVIPIQTPQLPILQPVIPTRPIPPPIVPLIAPIPTISPVPRLIAPVPVRPPIHPLPKKHEENDSDLDAGHDDSGPKRAALAMEYEISEKSKQAEEHHEKAMQELLMKRCAYALAVPINDSAVRDRLRRLGEPITIFGEKEMERRDRLRMIMVKLDTEGQLERLLKAHEDVEAAAEEGDGEGPQTYPFYTEGSNALLEARIDMAKYSIVRAALRCEHARRRRDDPDEDLDAEINWALRQAGDLALDCSDIGDDRPLTGC